MRQFDFAPLYRSTVGFDRLAQLMDSVGGVDADGYPPYNIERLGDNEYRITMAVAGFRQGRVQDRGERGDARRHRRKEARG